MKQIAVVLILLFTNGCKVNSDHRENSKPSEIKGYQEIVKMDGPERYAAFHHAIRTHHGQQFPSYSEGYRINELSKANMWKKAQNQRSATLPWEERGPGNVGGRTRGIWVDPADSTHHTVFVGSAGGGIWKTEDAGAHWQNLTPDFPNLATATIAGSPANPLVVYAGTGEGFGASRNILGDGIWKTEDGGETWLQLEATADREDISAVYRIVVNPEDEDEFFFSALANPRVPGSTIRSDIFKSSDGGASIQSVYTSEREIQQILADPDNFDKLYATVNGRGVMRSTNRGRTWRFIYETIEFGRIEMAISPANSHHLYLTAESNPPDDAPDQNTSHLIYSPNAGGNWYEVTAVDSENEFGDWFNGQGWYDNTVAAHPYDSLIVYVGGAGPILEITINSFDRKGSQYLGTMQPVTDGYKEYIFQYPESRTKGVHVDHHQLLLVPRDSVSQTFFIIDANDGGIAFSKDAGHTFLQTGDSFKSECLDFNCNRQITYETASGYNTAQFYGVDKKNGQDRYVAGTQDNGSWVSPIDPSNASKWVRAPSGDGFEAVWHYTKTNQLIESSQFNNLFRSDDNGGSWRRLELPGEGPFLSRVAGSQQDPDMLFGVTREGVIRSFDFGDHWQTIEMPDGWRFEGLATPVRISIASPNVVWTGSGLRENSEVAVSTDGGTTFSTISRYRGATLGLITNIATHPLDDSTAYFLFSQANGPKVIRTRDLGQTLEDISGFETNRKASSNGFPNVATYSLLVMPYNPKILWAGTEIGLFESMDDGRSWALADNGLPNASIWDMKVVNDEVVVATHGRGIWTVSLPQLENYEPLPTAFLVPQILINNASFAGRLSGEVQLRSASDSSRLTFEYINEGILKSVEIKLPANEESMSISFDEIIGDISGEDFIEVKATIESFSDASILRSFATELIHAVDTNPIYRYRTNFDDGQRDFALLDWTIDQPSDLESGALSSPHPYPNLDLSKAIFQKPILVTSNTQVDLDEIVLVEPGDTEEFPSDDFFDYCQIEATSDFGESWITIAGYDSRDNPTWLQAYNRNENQVSPALYVHRSFNLSDFSEEGDTVYLRFNLFSDPRLEGWGWSIDNFEINGEVTPVVETIFGSLEFNVMGNPVLNDLTIDWKSSQPLDLSLSLIDLNGRQIMDKEIRIMGSKVTSWSVSDWPSGPYFIVIRYQDRMTSVKWIKL